MSELVSTEILFFGRLREQLGQRAVDLPGAGCTVAELRRQLVEGDENGAALILDPATRVCIDQEFAGENDRVVPGQEIAFVSPLSGG